MKPKPTAKVKVIITDMDEYIIEEFTIENDEGSNGDLAGAVLQLCGQTWWLVRTDTDGDDEEKS